MTADVLGVKIDAQVLAAMLGAIGAVLAALITAMGRRVKRVEAKITGLTNGTYHEAMAAITLIQREREERRILGLPSRRKTDAIPLPRPQSMAELDERRH